MKGRGVLFSKLMSLSSPWYSEAFTNAYLDSMKMKVEKEESERMKFEQDLRNLESLFKMLNDDKEMTPTNQVFVKILQIMDSRLRALEKK